jgi:hypothetical protein
MCEGNRWTLHTLAVVMLCGMVAALLPMALKFVLHDDHMLGKEAEALTVTNQNDAPVPEFMEAQGRYASAVQHPPSRGCDALWPPSDVKGTCQTGSDASDSSERVLTTALNCQLQASLAAPNGEPLFMDIDPSMHAHDAPQTAQCATVTSNGTTRVEHVCPASKQEHTRGLLGGRAHACSAHGSYEKASTREAQHSSPELAACGDEHQTALEESSIWKRGCPSEMDSSISEPLLPLSGSAVLLSPNTSRAGTSFFARHCVNGNAERGVSQLAFYVPLLISMGDVTSGLAAGMTIKFFPIFFMDEVLICNAIGYLLTSCGSCNHASQTEWRTEAANRDDCGSYKVEGLQLGRQSVLAISRYIAVCLQAHQFPC